MASPAHGAGRPEGGAGVAVAARETATVASRRVTNVLSVRSWPPTVAVLDSGLTRAGGRC